MSMELLLIRKESVDDTKKFSLKENAIVGTSSARRKSQLLAFRPDVELKDLRGNVPTRIKKLADKEYDAILIAAAGVAPTCRRTQARDNRCSFGYGRASRGRSRCRRANGGAALGFRYAGRSAHLGCRASSLSA